MVGGVQHKVVLDESGFRAYCVAVDWGLNFLLVVVSDAVSLPYTAPNAVWVETIIGSNCPELLRRYVLINK